MPQEFQSHITFRCPKCREVSSGPVTIPEPDWSAAEEMSDLNSEGQISIQCQWCDTAYDAYVINNAGSVSITLIDFEEVVVDADHAFYSFDEDWPEPELPTDPADIFEDLQSEVTHWLKQHGNGDGGALINRMLFASLFSGLESFLSDTLIKAVTERPEALANLLEHDKDILTEKFTLLEISKHPNLVVDTVTTHLREILYHNLPKVNALYRIALGIDFFKMLDKEEVKTLNNAVQLRHHCVHRNGKDIDGNRLDVFTPEYVSSILDLTTWLVRKLDAAVSGKRLIIDDDDLPF